MVDLMGQLPAPEAILKLIHCDCIKFKCITNQCSCRANSLSCTYVCNCSENEFNLQIQVSAEDEENDSDIE